MSCKSNLYAVNTTSTTVAASSTIPLTTIIRRYGCDIDLVNGAPILKKAGYYLVNATITFTSADTGDVVVSLLNDNVAVVGATASATVTTATTEVNTISITAIVRSFCGSVPDTLALYNTGIAITTSNVALDIVKIV